MMGKLKILNNFSNQFHNIGVDGISEAARMYSFASKIDGCIKNGDLKNKVESKMTLVDKFDDLKNVLVQENSYNPVFGLSNHSNAGVKEATGVEAFYYPGDVLGKRIAARIVDYAAKTMQIKSRGVKSTIDAPEGGIFVVDQSKCSFILVEWFFHSNKNDIEKFKSNEAKLANQTAWILMSELVNWYGGKF